MKYTRLWKVAAVAMLLVAVLSVSQASSDHQEDDSDDVPGLLHGALPRADPNAALIAHDQMVAGIVRPGLQVSSGGGTQYLKVQGRGERLLPGATTDVWVLDKHAYIGTFKHLVL